MAGVTATKADLRKGDLESAHLRLVGLAKIFRAIPVKEIKGLSHADWAMPAAMAARDIEFAEALNQVLMPDNQYSHPLGISPAATLTEWCARHGVGYTVVDAPHDVVVEATTPHTERLVYQTTPVVYAVIPNGRWIAGWDFVIGSDGTVLIDTCYQPATVAMAPYAHYYAPQFATIMHYRPLFTAYQAGDTVLLSAPHQHHFGHFLIDFLPRLKGLEFVRGRPFKLAVPADLPHRFREMIALWGVSEHDLLLCRRDTQYEFESLHILKPGFAQPPNPLFVADVRRHLYGTPHADDSPRKRIFASRGKVVSREIKNWPEVKALLDAEGFIDVDMGALSINDQRKVMAGAEILLGVYGSNLFALYFAPPGCTVIALMPEGMADPVIAHSCGLLGLRHQFLHCAAADKREINPRKSAQMIVDTDVLRARISELRDES